MTWLSTPLFREEPISFFGPEDYVVRCRTCFPSSFPLRVGGDVFPFFFSSMEIEEALIFLSPEGGAVVGIFFSFMEDALRSRCPFLIFFSGQGAFGRSDLLESLSLILSPFFF